MGKFVVTGLPPAPPVSRRLDFGYDEDSDEIDVARRLDRDEFIRFIEMDALSTANQANPFTVRWFDA